MFRIRRIYDDVLPRDKSAILEIQKIIREQFPAISNTDIEQLPKHLKNPLKYRYRSILFSAEDFRGQVHGFALMLYFADLNFIYLDFISAKKKKTGKGIGGVLYERIREEARQLKTIGIFFECLPDDPALCKDPNILEQNKIRLKFYEHYGARPIINTKYETPLKPTNDNPPYLVFDNLGRNISLSKKIAKRIVRAILERKYGALCTKEYTDMVVNSFADDPVLIRPPKYIIRKKQPILDFQKSIPLDQRIALVVNDKHEILHIKERGYIEAPVRIFSILKHLPIEKMFYQFSPKDFSIKHITAVHDAEYVNYFRKMCMKINEDEQLYPYVFPLRHPDRAPDDMPIRAGYYCIDTFTPLTRNAFLAAKYAVDCALTATTSLLQGFRLSYALIRPPGHHAQRRNFGGFCYLNSSAISANYLSHFGKVAVLDIDYHHGNGTQDIFYERDDVLTISIHGHPRNTYPYFSGFADEHGEGRGLGFNINIPLQENISFDVYKHSLIRALNHIKKFRTQFLVVAFGLDTGKGDPTGTWNLLSKDFERMGEMIGELHLPTVVIQEGGYRTRQLGVNAQYFFNGLWLGAFQTKSKKISS